MGRHASRPLLISLKVRRMLKRTSGLYKLMSIVHRMSMKLESKFLDSLRIKAESLQRNKSVRNVKCAWVRVQSSLEAYNWLSCPRFFGGYSLRTLIL